MSTVEHRQRFRAQLFRDTRQSRLGHNSSVAAEDTNAGAKGCGLYRRRAIVDCVRESALPASLQEDRARVAGAVEVQTAAEAEDIVTEFGGRSRSPEEEGW